MAKMVASIARLVDRRGADCGEGDALMKNSWQLELEI
jgi:hypothetical protein